MPCDFKVAFDNNSKIPVFIKVNKNTLKLMLNDIFDSVLEPVFSRINITKSLIKILLTTIAFEITKLTS